MIDETIRKLRESRNWSQADLANQLNITRAAVNAWETGISNPSIPILVKLAEVFKVTTDYLLGIDTTEKIILYNLTKDDIHFVYEMVNHLATKN